ncbi:hypothetical protein [Halosolutus halophilus]|uniref:hypothetical protein n=1 Tax=Halosolutus halophilus TaxID=1552990 RepID=UPI002234F034|nr:hypothetical protein [Halosolutus halophilus]
MEIENPVPGARYRGIVASRVKPTISFSLSIRSPFSMNGPPTSTTERAAMQAVRFGSSPGHRLDPLDPVVTCRSRGAVGMMDE